MVIAAFMISAIGLIGAVVGIWFARRSATASEVSALQAKTATEVVQKQLAIERDRRRDELAHRHEADGPVLEGHGVRRDEDDGAGQARLEIRVTNSVQLTLVSLTMPARAPVSLHGREPMMAQDSQYPESGNGRIEVGRPAWWNVDLTGLQRPFEILVIAHENAQGRSAQAAGRLKSFRSGNNSLTCANTIRPERGHAAGTR